MLCLPRHHAVHPGEILGGKRVDLPRSRDIRTFKEEPSALTLALLEARSLQELGLED
jgi:hypothetical protein